MTATTPIIHVVDDDASFLKAVARVLIVSGYRVAVYTSGNELMDNLPRNERGCILLDLQMGAFGGLELQRQLLERNSVLPIVFLTGHGDIPTSVKAIKAGAHDFLSKPVLKDTLIEAIEHAVERYTEQNALRTRLDHIRQLVATLTPRENEVFALVVRGKLNKQIAFQLGTSERTVKAHRHAIMQKLKVRSPAEAVAMAERLGLLILPDQADN